MSVSVSVRVAAESPWARAVVCTAVLLAASVVPSPFPRHPGWRWVAPDKLLHLIGHAGYAVALADAFGGGLGRRDRDATVVAATLSIVLAVLTARLQTHVPGRRAEPGDVFAGALGALVGAVVWRFVADT